MSISLDENKYDENKLIQIKLPLHIPYLSNNKGYERCDGQVELNGIEYSYVKRMVQNDTLYLYCIPNNQKTALNNTKNQIAKQASDNPSGKKSGPSLKRINILTEFSSCLSNLKFDSYINQPGKLIAFDNCTILKGFLTKPVQPPDLFI